MESSDPFVTGLESYMYSTLYHRKVRSVYAGLVEKGTPDVCGSQTDHQLGMNE
jgi:hypothetical protein